VKACDERYSALMGHTKQLCLLLASALLVSVAIAQTKDSPTADGAPTEDAIAAARSQYTSTSSNLTDPSDGETLAQFRQRRPGSPFPQRGYPSASYRTPWMHQGSPGHLLIGAAIGFGVGAALGAHQSAHNGTPVGGGIILGGGVFGFLGGCIGEAVGDFPGVHYSSVRHRRNYRPSWPEDDEESDLRSHSKAEEGQ
jgi:hypothetical protein